MKRVSIKNILFLLLYIFFSISCQKEITEYFNEDIILKFTTKNIDNRQSNRDNTELSSSQNILINTKGNIIIKDELLVFNENKWIPENFLKWNIINKDSLFITALYPKFSNKLYTENEIYTDNLLEDILIAQERVPYESIVNLKFKHLFSKITLNLTEELKKDLLSINITVPYSIDKIDKENGYINIVEKEKTSTQAIDDSNAYDFITPPNQSYQIEVTLKYKSSIKTVYLRAREYKSNTNYIFNLCTNVVKGIDNADDFIAFTQLINNIDYPYTKKLSDFGEEENGRFVYKLINDIYLTEENCNKICPIGKKFEFKDIFDGQGHSINGLIIFPNANYSNQLGLFRNTSKEAIVKNIIFNSPIMKVKKYNDSNNFFSGFIVNNNNGIIDNCIINKPSIIITDITNSTNGCLTYSNNGTISNCGIISCTFDSNSNGIIGGITSINRGLIINSYNANCSFSIIKKMSLGGIATNYSGNDISKIINCYSDVNTNKNKYTANFMCNSYNLILENCFYTNKLLKNIINQSLEGDSTIINVEYFDKTLSEERKQVIQKLNNWVEENRTKYIDLNLRNWTESNNDTHYIIVNNQ